MKKGFTLLEVVITVAILGILASLILIQVDPPRRLHQAHNATRWSDILAILEATKRYESDNNSVLPQTATAIDADPATVQIIGESVAVCTCAGKSVLTPPCEVSGLDTDLQEYISAIPADPINGSSNDTRYYINVDAYDIVTVGACDAEAEGPGGTGIPPDISVTR